MPHRPLQPDRPAPVVLPYVYPLDEFYAAAGMALPQVDVIPGDAVPEPYRSLLVHHSDMTPTLQAFHGSEIHLEVLGSSPRGDHYFREVVLRLNRDGRPVEFGANKISLRLFSAPARQLILQEHLPLGQILKIQRVRHTTHAKAFLRLHSDAFIGRAFALREPAVLYGRRATIWDMQQRPLSEIVEILPPAGSVT